MRVSPYLLARRYTRLVLKKVGTRDMNLELMRQELLAHYPVGVSTEDAIALMNGVSDELMYHIYKWGLQASYRPHSH